MTARTSRRAPRRDVSVGSAGGGREDDGSRRLFRTTDAHEPLGDSWEQRFEEHALQWGQPACRRCPEATPRAVRATSSALGGRSSTSSGPGRFDRHGYLVAASGCLAKHSKDRLDAQIHQEEQRVCWEEALHGPDDAAVIAVIDGVGVRIDRLHEDLDVAALV